MLNAFKHNRQPGIRACRKRKNRMGGQHVASRCVGSETQHIIAIKTDGSKFRKTTKMNGEAQNVQTGLPQKNTSKAAK